MILYDCLKSKVMKLGESKNLIKLPQVFAFYFYCMQSFYVHLPFSKYTHIQ